MTTSFIDLPSDIIEDIIIGFIRKRYYKTASSIALSCRYLFEIYSDVCVKYLHKHKIIKRAKKLALKKGYMEIYDLLPNDTSCTLL